MVIHPLDTIKTRMQVTAQIPQLQAWQHAAAGASKSIRSGAALSLKGSGSSIVAASRGISDLYLGLSSAVITTLPAAAVFFATSEACKRMMEHHFKCDRRGMACHMVSSSAAAVASAFIRVPGDVLKHRIQAYMLPSNMAVSCGRVMRAHGLRGMYVGFGVTLMRDVPEIAIQFTVYDAMLRKIRGADEQQRQQGVVKAASHPLVLGAVAGATAAVATTPLDVIKTQLQCDGVSNASMAIQGVLARKGPLGFVAGMGPRVMQATLMSAVFFAFYEQLKLQLSDTRHEQHQLASKEEMQQQRALAQQQRRQQLMAPSAAACVPQMSEALLFNISLPLQSTMIVGSSS
ncbi:mitochondrial carrier domain-containing protein [Dunaliella salina]|uniref:Mitochondrial carrier domain-containing protein n=1 Tax=Dunaliella salina TaxID=3046 RepID=A0ABQ7GAQ5_DUNSA|nr:mitochondrial carrier domain-containing protein [Dunaliella salina]|eukprot:KAF5831687.1 mitochondrial carrier domain-containing protein [Dunaliella salina]